MLPENIQQNLEKVSQRREVGRTKKGAHSEAWAPYYQKAAG